MSTSHQLDRSTDLIGRERELAQFEELIRARRPTLAIVDGPPGIGKSQLLAGVVRRAVAAGWTTAQVETTGELLAIDPLTSEEKFRANVRGALREPIDTLRIESQIPSTGRVRAGPSQHRRPLAPSSAVALGAPPLLDQVARLVGQLRPLPLDFFVEELRAHAPVLIVIDDYRPSPHFGHWFENTFVPDIHRTEAPLLVAVIDRAGRTASLRRLAASVLSLGPLPEESVRHYFAELGRQVTPPLTAVEVTEYTRAVRLRPELLDRLGRLLQLSSETATSEPPATATGADTHG